jgi:hypothetical protein
MRPLLLLLPALLVGCATATDVATPATPPAGARVQVVYPATGDTLALPATLQLQARHPDQLHTVGAAALLGADTLASMQQHIHSQEYVYTLYAPRPDSLRGPVPCRVVAWFVDHNGATTAAEWVGVAR